MFQDEDVQGVPASLHAAACAVNRAYGSEARNPECAEPRQREALVLTREKRRREMRAFMFYLDSWSL